MSTRSRSNPWWKPTDARRQQVARLLKDVCRDGQLEVPGLTLELYTLSLETLEPWAAPVLGEVLS